MAQLAKPFMTGISSKIIEIFQRTGLSQAEFSRNLTIPQTYLSALQKEEHWKKIPAWVWFLFQEISNRRIEFNRDGQVMYISEGYTLEEVIQHCKDKAEEFSGHVKKQDMEVKKAKTGYNIDSLMEIIDELIDILIEDISYRDRAYKLMDLKEKISK